MGGGKGTYGGREEGKEGRIEEERRERRRGEERGGKEGGEIEQGIVPSSTSSMCAMGLVGVVTENILR